MTIGLFILLFISLGSYILYQVQPPIHDNRKYRICPYYDEDCESMTHIQHVNCFRYIGEPVPTCSMLTCFDPAKRFGDRSVIGMHDFIDMAGNIHDIKVCSYHHDMIDVIAYGINAQQLIYSSRKG